MGSWYGRMHYRWWEIFAVKVILCLKFSHYHRQMIPQCSVYMYLHIWFWHTDENILTAKMILILGKRKMRKERNEQFLRTKPRALARAASALPLSLTTRQQPASTILQMFCINGIVLNVISHKPWQPLVMCYQPIRFLIYPHNINPVLICIGF